MPIVEGGGIGLIETARVPVGALAVVEDEDTTLGLQLTVEYERAVGGMRSVLTFGAMMMQLRERLLKLMPTLGISTHTNTNAHDGQLPKGTALHGNGLANWLEKHAPTIKRQTAQRLEEVAKGVALEYEQIVGAKCAKQFTLAALVTTPADDLPEGVRLKQLDLFAFVDGTSQRSWLDKLRPESARKGGARTKGDGEPEPPRKPAHMSAEDWARYCGLDDHQREAVDAIRPVIDALFHEGDKERSFVPFLPLRERRELEEAHRALGNILASCKPSK